MIATAVLITREKVYPKEVLDSLPQFDEVIIETECPSIHRRYDLALKAKNDLIYVQDDDCIIDVNWLFKAYNGQLTNAITQHHLDFYNGSGITLVGYGTFFFKKMVDFKKYTDIYGINELFLSQTDRVFTFLNQPHNSVVMEIENLPRSVQEGRMSTSSDHWDNLKQISSQLNLLN